MPSLYDFYTYKHKRKCLFCETPIADQIHSKTIFCSREVLPDGSIKSCKDDYHSPRNRDKNYPFNKIAEFHKDMHQRLGKLLFDKGDLITTEQLDQYGIQLDRAVKTGISINQLASFYFIEFCLSQISKSQFKIIKHANNF